MNSEITRKVITPHNQPLDQENAFKEDAQTHLLPNIAQTSIDSGQNPASSKLIDTHDLSQTYTINTWLEDRDVIALACAEYAVLNKHARVNDHCLIIKVLDESVAINANGLETQDALKENNVEKVNEGIIAALNGNPVFFIISDMQHWVTVALCPINIDNNQSIHLFYMNSVSGQNAMQYPSCQSVGSKLCPTIIAQLKNHSASIHLNAEHLFMNSTQQLGNNCGAVAALNIAAIATCYQNQQNAFSSETLQNFMNQMSFNHILAKKAESYFVEYVKLRFTLIKNELSPLALQPKALHENSFLDRALEELKSHTLTDDYFTKIRTIPIQSQFKIEKFYPQSIKQQPLPLDFYQANSYNSQAITDSLSFVLANLVTQQKNEKRRKMIDQERTVDFQTKLREQDDIWLEDDSSEDEIEFDQEKTIDDLFFI